MPSPAVRLSPSATIRGVAGLAGADARGGADVSSDGGSAASGVAGGSPPPHEIAATITRERRTRSIPSILLSYTRVRGHHRLSTGVGARARGPGARPSYRRDRDPHAGSQVVGIQTGR